MAEYRYYFFAALSGLLLALAYPGWGFNLGWLVWIGLVPLFGSLTRFAYKNNCFYMRSGFLIGFISGFVYFLIIFRWFWSIYPLDTLGIENHLVSWVSVFLVYLISSVGMAVFWGLFGLVTGYWLLVTGKSKSYQLSAASYQLIILPAIFVLLEYVRSWGFGFLWAGSGSLFGPHWTLGNLAYGLANNSWARWIASYTGIYGVNFLVVLVNYLLTITIFKKQNLASNTPTTPTTMARAALGKFGKILPRAALGKIVRKIRGLTRQLSFLIICSGILFLNLLPKYFSFNTTSVSHENKINFAIVQTAQPTKLSYSPQEILASLEEQLKLLDRVAKEHPESQFIVFPEATDLFKNIALLFNSQDIQKYFSNLFKEPAILLAGGRITDENGNVFARTFALDTKEGIVDFYDKRLLTPGGEFLPYPIKLMAFIFSKTTVSQYGSLRELDVGTKEISTVNFRNQFKATPVICAEVLSPNLIAKTSENSDIIANMASYGVFHENRVIVRQMLANARFRTAETGKPLITAVNSGHSYALDNRGDIIKMAPDQAPQILTGSVMLASGKSWYNKVGDTPVLLGCLVLVIVFSLQLTVFSRIKTWLRRTKTKK